MSKQKRKSLGLEWWRFLLKQFTIFDSIVKILLLLFLWS